MNSPPETVTVFVPRHTSTLPVNRSRPRTTSTAPVDDERDTKYDFSRKVVEPPRMRTIDLLPPVFPKYTPQPDAAEKSTSVSSPSTMSVPSAPPPISKHEWPAGSVSDLFGWNTCRPPLMVSEAGEPQPTEKDPV